MIKPIMPKITLLIDKIILLSSNGASDSTDVYLYLSKLGLNILMSLVTAVVIVPLFTIVGLFSKYVITDRLFVEALFMLFLMDIMSGVIKHFKLRSFSFSELSIKFLVKFMVSLMFMISFNTIAQVPSISKHKDIVDYFTLTGQLANLLFIGGSLWMNLHVITDGIFPPIGWMKRMKSFNKSLNIHNLINTKDENRNIPN